MTTTPPTCFLSYAWADAAHQEWVQKLAADLMKNGVYTYLDQWDLKPGTDLPRFMELVGKSDWIGLVCTPEYRAKSELRRGGVGYESQLITRVLFEQVGTERASHVLPLLRKGTSAESVPAFLPAALYLDFRDDAHYESALEQLLRRIFDAPRDARPRLGAPPTFTAPGKPTKWVLVAGSGKEDKLAEAVDETSKLLGHLLAEAGFGLVSGGWPGVDRVVSRAFASALYQSNRPLEQSLTQVIRRDVRPAFPGGNLILVNPGEEEWTAGIDRADAVVLVEGFGGTLKTGHLALERHKPVLPLADTGGDAQEAYWELISKGAPVTSPLAGLSRDDLLSLARPAPSVATAAIEVLRKLFASAPG